MSNQNEPYMPDLIEMDLNSVLSGKGFKDISNSFAKTQTSTWSPLTRGDFPGSQFQRGSLAARLLESIKEVVWGIKDLIFPPPVFEAYTSTSA